MGGQKPWVRVMLFFASSVTESFLSQDDHEYPMEAMINTLKQQYLLQDIPGAYSIDGRDMSHETVGANGRLLHHRFSGHLLHY